MKLLSILILTFALSACGMSIEEYNTRVKYCKDNGLGVQVIYHKRDKSPVDVYCQDGDGFTFPSKEK